MASRRKLHPTTPMNFRPGVPEQTARGDAKGTRPTTSPTSVKEVLLMMVMHVCKKIIFFDTNLKVALYLGSLFLISLIGDFAPFPKTYFARSDNLFNLYFVKMGWAWTLLLSLPFLVLTSYVLSCGDAKKLLQQHLPRILIATAFWFIWTKLFNVIESAFGRCAVKKFDSKSNCLKAGYLWHGFDISGHAFILIYSSLVLLEEAKPIIKWETIKDYIRNEEYNRASSEFSSSNPLRNLSDDEIKTLKDLYEKYTPFIRTLFICMTGLQLLWDVMLVVTMLYYHRMIEKILSGIIAILTWFFTYRAWYPSKILPDPPGRGQFLYQRESRPEPTIIYRRQTSLSSTAQSTSNGTRNSQQSPAPPGGPQPKFTIPVHPTSRERQQQQEFNNFMRANIVIDSQSQ